jgi:uncharacterized protein YwqG
MEIQEIAVSVGLGKRLGEIMGLLRPSIRLDATPVDEALPVGCSRLGGTPDLGLGVSWPRWDGRPLAFVAQLNLAEIAEFGGPDYLPAFGTLSFFYDAQQKTWGFDPRDRGSFSVLYSPFEVSPATEPSDLELSYPVRKIRLVREYTLPAENSAEVAALNFQSCMWCR